VSFASYDNIYYSKKVFQAISVLLLLVFLYLVGAYLEKRLHRFENIETSFPIFQRTLFPTFKFSKVGEERMLVDSNTETVNFLLAALVLFIWSFLASFMLGE
jgi:hypothetical protein